SADILQAIGVLRRQTIQIKAKGGGFFSRHSAEQDCNFISEIWRQTTQSIGRNGRLHLNERVENRRHCVPFVFLLGRQSLRVQTVGRPLRKRLPAACQNQKIGYQIPVARDKGVVGAPRHQSRLFAEQPASHGFLGRELGGRGRRLRQAAGSECCR